MLKLDAFPRVMATAPILPTLADTVWSEFLGLRAGQQGPVAVPSARSSGPSEVMLDSFLMGADAAEAQAGLGWLRPGNRLGLRPAGAGRVEVCAPDRSVLGRLPPEDAQVVVDLMEAGAAPTARVRCVVPAFRRPRVQLAIEVEAQAA